MPAGDRKGPEGKGPRSGRGSGYCSGSDKPGYQDAQPGRGLGKGTGSGSGRGRGRRSWRRPPADSE
jgi:hypothetical protein